MSLCKTIDPRAIVWTIVWRKMLTNDSQRRVTTTHIGASGSDELNIQSVVIDKTRGMNQLNIQSVVIDKTRGTNQLNIQSVVNDKTQGRISLILIDNYISIFSASNHTNSTNIFFKRISLSHDQFKSQTRAIICTIFIQELSNLTVWHPLKTWKKFQVNIIRRYCMKKNYQTF